LLICFLYQGSKARNTTSTATAGAQEEQPANDQPRGATPGSHVPPGEGWENSSTSSNLAVKIRGDVLVVPQEGGFVFLRSPKTSVNQKVCWVFVDFLKCSIRKAKGILCQTYLKVEMKPFMQSQGIRTNCKKNTHPFSGDKTIAVV